jgi:hypothetical protein
MHFVARSFLGHTEENSWSQYWENEPEDLALASQNGHLFALANLTSDSDITASDIGHQLIDDINHQYFSIPAASIPTRLQETLENISHNPEYELADISLTIAIILQGNLYLAMLSSGYVFLKRDTQVSKIMSGTTGKINLVSGKLQDQDLLFICTSSYYDSATWENIKSKLSLSSIQEIEEAVLSELYSLPSQPYLASLLIGAYQDTISNPSPQLLPTPPTPSPSISQSDPDLITLPSPSIYISHHDSSSIKKRRTLNIIFSLIILFALAVSIYFGARRNHAAQLESQYQSIKSQYQIKIDNAKAVKNINFTEAQTLAKSAKESAQKMRDLNIHIDETDKLIAAADEILSQTGSSESYQPENFYDTALISSNAEYSQIHLAKNLLYLLDTKSGRIDKLDTSTKSQQKVISNDQLKNTQSIAENNGILYFLIDSQIYSLQGSSLTSVIKITDQIKDFTSGQINTWNGSLYLLGHTSSATSIWKFNPSGTSFSTAQDWIKSGSVVPSSASSLAINGRVWIITKSGEIIPYNRGVKEVFKSQVVSSLSQAGHLVTALDSEILAFTEGNASVYVYHKDGASASNYNFGNRHILDISLDGPGNRLFVLCTDKKIYKISL